MEIDEYINNLNSDLERQMQELTNSVNSSIGSMGISMPTLPTEQSSFSQEETETVSFCPECGAKIPAGSKFCGMCGTRIEETAEQTSSEMTEPTASDRKRFVMLQIRMENVTYYDIPDVPEMEKLWEYFDDELAENGLTPEDDVLENLPAVVEAVGVETLGNEYGDGPMHCPASLTQIYVCYDRTREEWYEYDEEKRIDEFYGDEVDFDQEERDVLEHGITFIGTQPPCSNCFALYLNEGEEFDLSLLSVRTGWKDGSMLIATYNDEELEFLGMGAGDEDNDYFEDVQCYIDGEYIHLDETELSEYDIEKSSVCTNNAKDFIGILFTDTEALSKKYDCDKSQVLTLMKAIINQTSEHGMHWRLLDASEHRKQLGKDPFWLDYNELLSDFMQKEGFKYGMKTPVFIIGGDDVIPIPMVEDTYGTSDNGKMPCDMCYCFNGHFFSDLWDGDRTITENYVRNTIARLPLEDGNIKSSISDDLEAYFNLCSLYYKDGIPANHVMMTSNSSWLPASKTMSEHLPLVNHADDGDVMKKHNMYVAPPVNPSDKEVIGTVSQSMNEAGMLLFNLHGASKPGMNSFYSDKGEAFSRKMLHHTNARVLNTVACYGARYHGYKRDDSMLLTSFYKNGFLLYAGSLIPVPMTTLNIPKGVVVHPGSGSEHLMPIYCMEQYAGLSAGEAMMKAKLEYFNTFRHLERDDFSMATMQMFSLYGNPMLRLQRNEKVLQRAKKEHVLPTLPQSKDIPVRMKRMQRIMTKENSSASLLADISGAVNTNLDAIHTAIANDLYAQLGLEPRMIDHIDAYTIPVDDGSMEKGFMYAYINEDRDFDNKTWVEVDENGMLKRVIRAK